MTRARFPMRSATVVIFLSLAGACGGGGGSGGGASDVSGPVSVTLSDPPVCEAPNGPFSNVWVTITRVRAHISGGADPTAAGWVDILDLTTNPMQVDLLNIGTTTCLLTNLGATSGLPVGNYQQLRLHLLSNNPPAGAAVPVPNNCAAAGGYNCVVHTTLGPQPLLLSSQANNGIKIPPGRIVGGAITVGPGEAVDINIDFDACRSIIQQGNGSFRLRPTLSAGEVSPTAMAISGRVVVSQTLLPIPGATVIVLAEMPDAAGIDRVFGQSLADPSAGSFIICPLPVGSYDIVIAAVDGSGAAWHPSVTFAVPVGSAMGDIPLVAIAGTPNPAATITGTVTSAGSAGPAEVDLDLTVLQAVTPPGGSPLLVTMPLFPGSTPALATAAGAACTAGTACATYTLVVPPGNAGAGIFVSGGGTAWSLPPAPPVGYTVGADAFQPGGEGLPACAPSTLSTNQNAAAGPLEVAPGAVSTAATLAFTGC